MPPKSRIEERAFQAALRSLRIDELPLLDSSTSTGVIWSRLCIQMGKPNNIENQRACYDVWKHKKYNSHDIVSRILLEAQQSTNTATIQNNIAVKDLCSDGTTAQQVDTVATTNSAQPILSTSTISTPYAITTNNNQIKEAPHSSHNTTMEQNAQFMEQLCMFLSGYKQKIPIIHTHDFNSTNCSGDVVSIQVICKCAESSSNILDQKENSLDLLMSTNANEQHSHTESELNNNLSDLQSELATNNTYGSEKKNILMPTTIIDDDNENRETITTSPMHDPLQLLMSPISSVSSAVSPKSIDVRSSPVISSESSVVSRILTGAKNILSRKKTPDHKNISGEQQNVLTLLQRRTNDTSPFIKDIKEIQDIERKKAIVVSQSDMEKLKKFCKDALEKKANNKKKNTTTDLHDVADPEIRKRNLDWTLILDTYVKQSNDYCVFIYERHYFTSRPTIGNTSQFFMSADAHCKFETCRCRLHAILNENGELKVSYSGKQIYHDLGETQARPIRGSRRKELQQFTALGSSPGAVRLQQLRLLSPANKEAGNRNVAGATASVIRKISSEGNVKLRHDDDLDKSLRQIKIEQANKIFPGEQMPGYLQEINTDPLRLIFFTAGGLAMYHQFASSMPLSWDATGGIVINRGKKIFYYELTMSNLIKGGPSLPIAVMISESHKTTDIVHWMNCFIEKYKIAFGFSNPFPKPPVIHSDRATVFLLGGIQIFNKDETMKCYIERCWRIVKQKATQRDLEITVVHACLGHFMKNVKNNAFKDLTKKQIPFGMWLMALLVNSSILDEMVIAWRNICIVLLSPNRNDQFKISLSTLAKMAEEMNGNPDKTNFVLNNVSVSLKGEITSTLDIDKSDNVTSDVACGEEEAVLYIESSFKELFTTIYQECKERLKTFDAPEWATLPQNPLFSAAYLARLLKLYMPTAPIWSNLLLGNFARRYNYPSDSVISPCTCHFGRTTGASESQMRVLKEAILAKKIYTRVDEVATKLGETIEAIEIQFSDHAIMKKQTTRVLPATKQKSAIEPWNKHKKSKNKFGLYTSEKPCTNLVTMMNTKLLSQNDDALLDIGQLTQFLQFENKQNNSWYNSIFQMVLASGQIVGKIRHSFHVGDDGTQSDAVSIVRIILNNMVNMADRKSAEGNKAIVKDTSINEDMRYLRWARINISYRDKDCVFSFFKVGIVPLLLHYDIDLQFLIDNSLKCSSCAKISSIQRQAWNFLFVHRTNVKESLDNVLAELFSQILEKKACPNCYDEGPHYTSLSIINCPKHLFIHCAPSEGFDQNMFQLTPHIDITKIISSDVVFAHSYSHYTLQSFITFYKKEDFHHYFTYVRHKGDWFSLDDMDAKIVSPSSIFQNQAKYQPIVLAHYIRPSETDVFSTALFNIFTNFSQQRPTLTPTLSLNDAVNYFAKNNLFDSNPLNLVIIKYLNCRKCEGETYIVNRMHEIWQMKSTTDHINDEMTNFIDKQVICSICKSLGPATFALYDIPQFLLLKTRSNDTDCIQLIDEIDLLSVKPSITCPSFEYSIHTVLFVLAGDEIFYLRKTASGYSSYNKLSGRFETLHDSSAMGTGRASSWTILAYETKDVVFKSPRLEKKILDPINFLSTSEPDVSCNRTVLDRLASLTRQFEVGPAEIKPEDIKMLIDDNGDINDLIINSHLYLTASNAPANYRVLAMQTYFVSDIIENRLKHIPHTWLKYDVILCPISQNKHWYLVILDLKQKLILEFDSLRTHTIPRAQNIHRLLHFLNAQSLLTEKTDINFQDNWNLVNPDVDLKLQQTDIHSCGVHLLLQARTYVNNNKFVHIPANKTRPYRFQIAQDILNNAEPTIDDDDPAASAIGLTPDFDRRRTKTNSKQKKS